MEGLSNLHKVCCKFAIWGYKLDIGAVHIWLTSNTKAPSLMHNGRLSIAGKQSWLISSVKRLREFQLKFLIAADPKVMYTMQNTKVIRLHVWMKLGVRGFAAPSVVALRRINVKPNVWNLEMFTFTAYVRLYGQHYQRYTNSGKRAPVHDKARCAHAALQTLQLRLGNSSPENMCTNLTLVEEHKSWIIFPACGCDIN